MTPHLVLVASLDRNRAIGRGGALLWSDPEDLRHFRRLTMGAPVIMGRKTWDSLPERFRPLPGRRNIVVTRNGQWRGEGADRAASLADALVMAADAPRAFVIGGAELYALALAHADELALTEVDAAFGNADAFFPAFDPSEFVERSREPCMAADGTPFSFVGYARRRASAAAA
jgi:dihydrofolate reductase